MTIVTRRALLVTAALAALAPRLAIADPSPEFVIDWQGGEQTPALLTALQEQVALVKSLAIKAEVVTFFAEQVITVDLIADTKTRAGARGVFFQRSPLPPPENPVLLHELLHRYHLLKLADGVANPTIIGFYDRAKEKGDWPRQAYLYTNVMEFFAMVASVSLCGHAARPPYTRALVRKNLPDMYAWIVEEFGLSA
jgi:hypothetical protein